MKLTGELLGKIKKNLESEADKIRRTLESLKQQDPFSDPERVVDNAASDTEANEEINHERVEALEKELKYHLDEIVKSIEKIDSGTYGICQACKKYISAERLNIKPTALFCFSCEEKKET